jgi:diguanylate cyclase (GGDEF)-like protein
MDEKVDNAEESLESIIAQYEKKIYDLQQLLQISLSLSSTLEFATLIESFLYICMCQMHVMGAGIFTLDPINTDHYSLGRNYSGIEPDPTIVYSIASSSRLIETLDKKDVVFTIEELKKQHISDDYIKMLETLNPTLIIPLFQKNHMNGILVLGERIDLGEGTEYSLNEKEQILMLASLAAVAINNAILVEQSSTDMMTHLKLKYYFNRTLTNNLDQAVSQNVPLSVIMYDIDFFKSCNDTYGHACGDYVLKEVAGIIKDGIRSLDLACRFGGEEFIIMLKNTTGESAVQVAERIRDRIAENDFLYEGHHIHITISGGVACYDSLYNPVTVPKELVKQADDALYVSKKNGRNRITFACKD